MIQEAKPKKGYWYYTVTYECVLCGREEVYRERRYTPKPKEHGERFEYHQTACPQHFC